MICPACMNAFSYYFCNCCDSVYKSHDVARDGNKHICSHCTFPIDTIHCDECNLDVPIDSVLNGASTTIDYKEFEAYADAAAAAVKHFCPCCHTRYEIASVNCGVFRCGNFLTWKNGRAIVDQIPPHASEKQIQEYRDGGLLSSGCGAPLVYDKMSDILIESRDANGNRLYN